ncbi:MAG: hypothetical protein IKO86_02655 [Prevotella sp.]|nr:hypothetical protein [Prevotella sp.]
MKKTLVVSMGALLLLTSCGTYTGQGAYVGGSFGSIIGSAVGGIAGGWRGSDVGSLIGMAGGAAVGAAIGSAADKAEQRRYEEYAEQRRQRRYEDYGTRSSERSVPQYDENDDQSGFDSTNSGDDRLYGFGEDFSAVEDTNTSTLEIRSNPLEIRNAHIVDASHDGVLSRGEQVRMVFEVFNNSSKPVFQVQPTVSEVTGNKHIRVSENVLVESIMPGKGIRYTAVIKADDRLKDGEAVFRVSVLHRNKEVASQTKDFPIQTKK